MKKLSYLIASSMLVSLGFNSFAGTGDLPKTTTKEEAIEIVSPNDDPTPPPNTTFTYYLITVKASHLALTSAEVDAEPNLYYINNTVTNPAISKPPSGGIPSGGSLLVFSAACRAEILNTPMCSGCRTWGKFFDSGLTVTSEVSGLTMSCSDGGL